MADVSPPDRKKGAGRKGNNRSGKVADFRYKSSPPPDTKTKERRPGRDAARDAGREARARSGTQGNAQNAARTPQPRGPQQRPPRGGPHARQAYAALDLGTNNCRLLIARPTGENFTVIDAFSRVVKLGEGLAHSGRLSDAAMDRALAALKICSEKLQRRNVWLARSVATEACRRAENGAEFIARVREETGIVLDIITAQEEARLAVLGCHILLEQGDGRAVIFDIGGGSTELVLIEPDGRAVPRILDWQSVPWGVVSLSDMVPRAGPGLDARIARYAEMRRVVSESFGPFAERVAEAANERDIRLLGTSGTVTTLASLHLELPQYDRRAVDGLIVPSSSMREISGRLSTMSMEERCALPCIGNDRAELVVAGCAILEAILDIWPAEKLGVADRGIREGILRSLMAADHNPAYERAS
jgi:exopolyphosphatase/guanosine-5'-triphosphate,3'-diphosphate pyrophosphatase